MLPAYTRLMCGQVLSIKENDYVLAGKEAGSKLTKAEISGYTSSMDIYMVGPVI